MLSADQQTGWLAELARLSSPDLDPPLACSAASTDYQTGRTTRRPCQRSRTHFLNWHIAPLTSAPRAPCRWRHDCCCLASTHHGNPQSPAQWTGSAKPKYDPTFICWPALAFINAFHTDLGVCRSRRLWLSDLPAALEGNRLLVLIRHRLPDSSVCLGGPPSRRLEATIPSQKDRRSCFQLILLARQKQSRFLPLARMRSLSMRPMLPRSALLRFNRSPSVTLRPWVHRYATTSAWSPSTGRPR